MAIPNTISLQLYSVRREIATDLPRTLEGVTQAGFSAVELYGFAARKNEYRELLTDHGLVAPTAHARLTPGESGPIFEAAVELGVGTIIDPFIPAERWTTPQDVERIAEQLVSVAAEAASYGLAFGYHNHAWEVSMMIDGRTALEALALQLPAEILFELDVYWAAVGGSDPVRLLESLGERVRFLHVKDGRRATDGGMSADRHQQVPVGEGVLPWAPILAATTAAEVVVVEFDEYEGDVLDAAGRSLRAIRAIEGEAGRG